MLAGRPAGLKPVGVHVKEGDTHTYTSRTTPPLAAGTAGTVYLRALTPCPPTLLGVSGLSGCIPLTLYNNQGSWTDRDLSNCHYAQKSEMARGRGRRKSPEALNTKGAGKASGAAGREKSSPGQRMSCPPMRFQPGHPPRQMPTHADKGSGSSRGLGLRCSDAGDGEACASTRAGPQPRKLRVLTLSSYPRPSIRGRPAFPCTQRFPDFSTSA